MKHVSKMITVLGLGILIVLTACAAHQSMLKVSSTQGEAVISMKASNFKFEPNNIEARKGDELTFHIENVTGIEHDFTIESPKGTILQDVTLPAGKKATVRVKLTEVGTYSIYCDKPFHKALGMTGQVEVLQSP